MKKIYSADQFKKVIASAIKAHQNKNFTKAEKLYLNAIQFNPDNPQIRYLLGILYGEKGVYAKAMVQLKRAVKIEPENPDYLNHYGLALGECGQEDSAIASLKKSVSINPENAEAWNNLGLILMKEGEYKESDAALNRARVLAPDDVDVYCNLGILNEKWSRSKVAVAAYMQALEIEPRNLKAGYGVVSLLPINSNIENLKNSIDYYLERDPGHYFALLCLGKLELLQQGHLRAIEIFTQMIKKNPGNIELLLSRAEAFLQIGEKDKAKADFRKAKNQHPGKAATLVLYEGVIEDNLKQEKVESLLSTGYLSKSDRAGINFTLGKFYYEKGDLKNSFRCYHEGNSIKRSMIDYDVRKEEEYLEGLENYYRLAHNSNSLQKTDGCKPIFIIGMPRSGTSLVEQILDCHSCVHGMGELETLSYAIHKVFSASGNSGFFEQLAGAIEEDYRNIRDIYCQESSFGGQAVRYQTDKMPFNFMHVGIINQSFIDSPIILCQRQPEDICLSIYTTLFSGNVDFSYSQKEVARYYKAFEKLTSFWLEHYPGRIHVVKYEELVTNPEAVVSKLLDYCHLEWEDQCLQFHESKRPVITVSTSQVRKKLYTSSVDRWKVAEPYIQEMLSSLG